MRHATDVIRYAIGPSALGRVLVARTSRGLCAVLPGDSDDALEADLRARFPRAELVLAAHELNDLLADVDAVLSTSDAALDAPIDPQGTPFQKLVWDALRGIPAGRTATYTEIAARIGRPGSVRAVAGACGANPLAVVIPCHRVIRSDGGLSGYRWGLQRKQLLLERESRVG